MFNYFPIHFDFFGSGVFGFFALSSVFFTLLFDFIRSRLLLTWLKGNVIASIIPRGLEFESRSDCVFFCFDSKKVRKMYVWGGFFYSDRFQNS